MHKIFCTHMLTHIVCCGQVGLTANVKFHFQIWSLELSLVLGFQTNVETVSISLELIVKEPGSDFGFGLRKFRVPLKHYIF